MDRTTALGAAAALTLTVAGGVTALAMTTGAADSPPPEVVTEYVDQAGNPVAVPEYVAAEPQYVPSADVDAAVGPMSEEYERAEEHEVGDEYEGAEGYEAGEEHGEYEGDEGAEEQGEHGEHDEAGEYGEHAEDGEYEDHEYEDEDDDEHEGEDDDD